MGGTIMIAGRGEGEVGTTNATGNIRGAAGDAISESVTVIIAAPTTDVHYDCSVFWRRLIYSGNGGGIVGFNDCPADVFQ